MKTISKAFSALSPLWQMIFAIIGIAMVANFEVRTVATAGGEPILNYEMIGGPAFLPLAVLFIVALIAGQLAINRYNRSRSKHAKKLSIATMHPPELLESDERLGQTTANATRNVYVYNNYALPILIISLLFLHGSMAIIATISIVYVIGYYGTYLRTIWPVLKEA